MENERPKKRHSLLPQRATSIAANGIADEPAGKLAPPPKPKHRDISPSKLPIGGGLRRTVSTRPTNGPSRQPGHKSQQSSSRDDLPIITHVRSASTAQGSTTSKKPSTLGRSAISHVKQLSQASRPPSSHKASTSTDAKTTAARPGSSDKDSKAPPLSSTRAPSRTLANVKVQRPATSQARPTSPRKAPKGPPVNKFATLTTPPAPALKPAQEAKLELLHLHSLHKESALVKRQWSLSAKQHYEKHFIRLIQLEEDLKVSEIDFLEQQNASALIDWCREVCTSTGEAKTKVLSSTLGEMWLFVSPGGRYTAAVAAFEDWHSMVEKELNHRLNECHVDVMEGLGDGWKAEVDALMSALCRMSDDLESAGPAIEPSDLARCINVLMTMMANMLEELVLIRDIEAKLVEREGSFWKGRIEGLNALVSAES